MPQSLSSVHLHLVFSTKNREPFLRDMIANQEQHHQKLTFQDEYRAFLRKHDVAWDERFVWD
jgi:hypothetical protein